MPSGAKKRKAAKKKALSLLRSRSQHDILSAQEVTAADVKRVIIVTEGDACTHEDIMNTMKSRHLQTDVDVSHIGAAAHSSMNEDSMDFTEVPLEQTDRTRIHIETTPSTSEGCMSNAELHPDGAAVDHDEKMTSTNASVQENATSLGQSTRRHQDIALDGTLATRGSLRDNDTRLELSESASDIALPISTNGDSHEDIGQCLSCLQLWNDQCAKLLHISTTFATDMEHARKEQVSASVDKGDCNLPCHFVDDNTLSNFPAGATLPKGNCIVKQLVLTQSSPVNKNHADKEKNAQELSLATGWWGCCGIFDWLLGKS